MKTMDGGGTGPVRTLVIRIVERIKHWWRSTFGTGT
jgi:hypothetical protein